MFQRTFPQLCVLLLGGAFLFSSCTKEEQEDLKLEAELLLEYNSLEFTIDSGIPSGAFELALSFDGNALNDLLTSNGYSMDQLKEFRFNKADLTILGPEGQTYDVLQRVSMEVALNNAAPVTIASMDPIPDGLTALDLSVADLNVAEILSNGAVEFRIKAELDRSIDVNTLHKVDLGGKVVVQL